MAWLRMTLSEFEGHFCCLKPLYISPILRQILWLPVRHRVIFKIAVLVFQCLTGQAPAYLADDCQLTSDFDRRTQQCASFDVPITLLVTGVLRPLVHVYGTRCRHIYASVIVSDNLNGCSRLICLVLETAAFCDIFVRSAVYKSSYLLTYFLTCNTCNS